MIDDFCSLKWAMMMVDAVDVSQVPQSCVVFGKTMTDQHPSQPNKAPKSRK